MTVLVVNNERFLINEESKSSDDVCKTIIDSFPSDAIIEFDTVKDSDVMPKTIEELINEERQKNKLH